jgi:hypothetical protein
MTHPRDYLPALDQIEVALEATCGALVTVESICGQASPRVGLADGTQEHIEAAVGALRKAIEELRSAQTEGATGLAMGFVLERDTEPDRETKPDSGQINPHRTA